MDNYYFLFDKNKCVGCEACIVACMNEKGFQESNTLRNIQISNENKLPGLPLYYLSMSCNHCKEAVCMDNCPALAYSRSVITGAIIHDTDKCIGCQYCTWNCPYEAPKYNPFSGVIEKCDFCESRIIDNQKPACVEACPTGALAFSFEEIDKKQISTSLHIPVNTYPSIVIKELENKKAPKIDNSLFEDLDMEQINIEKKPQISAKKEWPLLIFTFVLAIMVSYSVSDFFVEPSLNFKIIFVFIGILAALLSFLHLGNKKNAWRSILNIKKSWLSREIFLYILFLSSVFLDFFIYDFPNSIIISLGILLLISIDMLYQPVQWNWKIKVHSAQILFIALTFYLFFNSSMYLFSSILILRVILYLYKNHKKIKRRRVLLLIIRTFSALLAILLLVLNNFWIALFILTIGEILDRIDFYNKLKIHELSYSLQP